MFFSIEKKPKKELTHRCYPKPLFNIVSTNNIAVLWIIAHKANLKLTVKAQRSMITSIQIQVLELSAKYHI